MNMFYHLFNFFQKKYIPEEYFTYIKPHLEMILKPGSNAPDDNNTTPPSSSSTMTQ